MQDGMALPVRLAECRTGTRTVRVKRRAPLGIVVELLPYLTLFAIVYLFVFYIQLVFPKQGIQQVLRSVQAALEVFRLCILIEGFRRYLNDAFVFRDSVIVHRHGLLSTQYHVSTLAYSDLREVRIEQSLLERILGYGNIRLGTASTAEYEITLIGIGQPEAVSRYLQKNRLNEITLGGGRA